MKIKMLPISHFIIVIEEILREIYLNSIQWL